MTIPDVGVGREVKEGFGQTQFNNRWRRPTEEEPSASPQGRADPGDALLAQAVEQAPAAALQQFAIPEVMESEAVDQAAERFAALSRGAGTKASLGDRDGALAEAEALIKLQPWNAEAHLYKAQLLNQARRFAEAETAAREAVRLDPKNAEAWKALGWAELHQRKFAAAEKDITQAIQLLEARRAGGEDTPELRNALASAYAMRAFAYEGLGQREKMLADLEKAARLDSKFAGHLARARAGKILFDPDAEDSWTLLDALPTDGGAPPFKPLPWALGGLAAAAAGALYHYRRTLSKMFLSKDARTKRELSELMEGEAVTPPKEGDVLGGKYRLAAFVGSDAAGEQWEAVDAALNRTVAVRRLDAASLGIPGVREKLRAESRIAAALQHPNIVAVFEALDLPNGVYLVMEHAPGRTVEQMLTGAGPFSPGGARRVLESAAAALEYARAQGVSHRGLKTSSLVVTDGGVVKVRDFASATGGPGGDDLRALGACLYEMLTGLPLAVGDGRFSQGIRWPSQVRPGLPPAADQLVAGALNPDPAQRFRSAAEFVAALAALGPLE